HYSSDPVRLRWLRGRRRAEEGDVENDREPDQPHAAEESSRRPPFTTAPQPGQHRGVTGAVMAGCDDVIRAVGTSSVNWHSMSGRVPLPGPPIRSGAPSRGLPTGSAHHASTMPTVDC